MITETKLLEVGDVLYEYGNYGIYNKVTVERVTPKTAFLSDGYKCPRIGWNNDCTYFSKQGEMKSVSGLSHYRIENEDMIAQWFRKSSLETISKYRFGSLNNDELRQIINIITKPETTN